MRAPRRYGNALSPYRHLLALLVCLATLAAFAQQSPPKDAPPVLRVTTRLVLVSAIVQDKKGNPVTDLTKDDFILLERGKEQAISTFALESSRVLPREATTLPPNTFSNRLENRTGVPTSITVILLDGLNTAIQDQAYARQQVVKFLQQIQPQDRVAIYAMGRNSIRVVHDFSSDPTALLAALRNQRGRISPEEQASNEPTEPITTGVQELDDFIAESSQRMADFYTIDRALMTVAALEALANHLARFPGRKNLIWVSSSFPMAINIDNPRPTADRRTFFSETESASRALSNANVSIYPVDARGLMAAITMIPPATMRGFNQPLRTGLEGFRYTIDTMQSLAERTGGKAYYNRNDIDGAVRSAMDDSRVSYVLGYYPAHGKWDGHFVELKVKVKRPGLRVRARAGYFADAEGKAPPEAITTLLREAASSPLDATSLGLQVRVNSVEANGKKLLKLAVDVDTRDITLHREGDRWVGALDFYFGQRSTEGKSLTGVRQTLDMHLKEDTYQRFTAKKTVTLNGDMTLKEETVQVRVVVRDSLTGAVGSVNIPVAQLQPADSVSPRASPPR
ncbi:MAG: VWA domain-containing protein [Acidobacteria bacterium]|nr:VWA domain-containing protein [Acidobacteriota bacterium]MCL5287839.1 VWA domain-containing protein [Acidobacteriota bacterium]